jgi:hypothetical protein
MATKKTVIKQMMELIGDLPVRWKEKFDPSIKGMLGPLN